MMSVERKAQDIFEKYDGYYDVAECLSEVDPYLLAELCRERGRRIKELERQLRYCRSL